MKTIIVTAGVIIENGRILVTQRKGDSSQAFLWEFPGGKVKEDEEPREALKRELKEELDIEVEVGRILEAVYHPYPESPILLLAYSCNIKKGKIKPIGCNDTRWVNLKELNKLSMPPPDQSIRRNLCFLNIS